MNLLSSDPTSTGELISSKLEGKIRGVVCISFFISVCILKPIRMDGT